MRKAGCAGSAGSSANGTGNGFGARRDSKYSSSSGYFTNRDYSSSRSNGNYDPYHHYHHRYDPPNGRDHYTGSGGSRTFSFRGFFETTPFFRFFGIVAIALGQMCVAVDNFVSRFRVLRWLHIYYTARVAYLVWRHISFAAIPCYRPLAGRPFVCLLQIWLS